MALLCAASTAILLSSPVSGQTMAFKQAVAETAWDNDGIAEFYRTNGYRPIWTGEGKEYQARRAALIETLKNAEIHGLPAGRYAVQDLLDQMGSARSTRDLGKAEVALSREFMKYANDVQYGVLVPSRVDAGMVRTIERRPASDFLTELTTAEPARYMRQLAPVSAQYRALLKQKLRLEKIVAAGGWGPSVSAKKLEPGDRGPAVVALRNRLIQLGFMPRSATGEFDARLEEAVRDFQTANGLEPDGVAGPGTLKEINRTAESRLKSVIVALERERWLPYDRGPRHILVNQTDFTARILDHGKVTFETRAVIGKNTSDRRSPEFSDVMEHMIINPSWHVPRSIITKEYLPQLQANPNAAGHLLITDVRGRQVDRSAMDFTQFSARNFPFAMRQPPSSRNALGLVKFMFPNKHNIYLHDTPQKNLFSREVRAYSHGCIRLAQPFEFAYALLARQEEDPKTFFHRILKTGRETKVELEQHVPVHLIYRTAYVGSDGQIEFRRDVYGR
ncbi:MAG: L,D-transpeptidase family protein, partial [Pseudomonadota bacterium]